MVIGGYAINAYVLPRFSIDCDIVVKNKSESVKTQKLLEINGLGYKAAVAGSKIVLTLGYSHKIEKDVPAGVSVEVDKSGQKVKVKSFDKNLVGQFCSNIRKLREPEPYKGKGIKLQTEVIFRKSAGKGKK